MVITSFSAYSGPGKTIIIDSKHYSNVLGEIRNYRIFLPPGYYDDPDKRYPVIYFYHGWSQRYFGSINSTGSDEGDSNNGDNIANFVAAHDVIVVKPDGYNRKQQEEYYLRPYNISPVETYRQYPLYFPELVKHIDDNFKTLPDRNHRAISGLSMGGFMTYWISGKYPHLVSAAGNFCGSTEFFVGPQGSPAEYRHIDMAMNYDGLRLRLNYGNKDFIRCYHRDLNRIWPQIMDNYEFKIYKADHTTCGLGEMFEFIMDTFKNPPPEPEKWNHIDVYPEFDLWNYNVSSDREMPGFTVLENVDKRGFRSSVREFLPDGELMPSVRLSVITAPIYGKNQSYTIKDFDLQTWRCTEKKISSNESGRLKIDIDGGLHEIGINTQSDKPIICLGGYEISNHPWVVAGKETMVRLHLVNKGAGVAENVRAVMSPFNESSKVIKSSASFGKIEAGKSISGTDYLSFSVIPDTIEMVRLKLVITDGSKNEWTDHVEIPVRKDPPEFEKFEIADGRLFNVAADGIDTAALFLGRGNGDGIANPGESIVILVKDQGLYRRTELFTSDTLINPGGINNRLDDNWSNYDHVGGSAKYSVPLISSDCPDNQKIEFLASYWLPSYPDHIIKYGKVSFPVWGKDNTPPEIRWTKVTGDNCVQVKVRDGSNIKSVKAHFVAGDDQQRTFDIVLNDEGINGDRVKNDRLFSGIAPKQKFGLFRMDVEATDAYGNRIFKNFEKLDSFH
jgi:enterochelin esterase-like enzyme